VSRPSKPATGSGGARLTRRHLAAPPQVVAPGLLGATLRVGDRAGLIVEVEAYGGSDDPASHAFAGERPRNRSMFGPPGRLYVYRSYGIHACANVVTGDPAVGAAVLIRALRPVRGIPEMREARPGARRDVELTSGPGRLCEALGITLDDDGLDLFDPGSRVRLTGPVGPAGEVRSSGRVGISRETERPWRFWLADDPHVSRRRPGRPPVTRRRGRR
jgi:DNA-3-methyladenine glycosylase